MQIPGQQVSANETPSNPSVTPANFSTRNYFMVAIYWFAISFLWGGFLGVVLPALNKPLASSIFGANNVESVRGVMSGIGLVIAMFVQPLAGAISDRSAHPLGRRRPFMIAGTLGVFLALALVGLAGSWWLLLIGYLLLQFADNIAQGSYQGLMPDVVPENRRGKASAALAISQLSGTLAGAVVPALLQGIFGDVAGSQIDLVLVAAVFTISLSLTVVFVKETPYRPAQKVSAFKTGLSMFQGVRQYPDFLKLMLARFLFLTAPATVSLFVKSFLENQGFINPEGSDLKPVVFKTFTDSSGQLVASSQAGGMLSLILGIVILMATLAAYPFSVLSERTGRKAMIYLATLIGLVGGFGLLIPNFMINGAVSSANQGVGLAQDLPYLKAVLAANQAGQLDSYLHALDATRGTALLLIVVFGAFIGVSWGAFMAVDWAFATDLIPLDEAGRFMGLSNLATAGCQAFGALVGGFVADSIFGYTGLFVVLSLYYISSALILTQVRETRGRQAILPTVQVA